MPLLTRFLCSHRALRARVRVGACARCLQTFVLLQQAVHECLHVYGHADVALYRVLVSCLEVGINLANSLAGFVPIRLYAVQRVLPFYVACGMLALCSLVWTLFFACRYGRLSAAPRHAHERGLQSEPHPSGDYDEKAADVLVLPPCTTRGRCKAVLPYFALSLEAGEAQLLVLQRRTCNPQLIT